ncbi:MAG: hypothetical protein K9N23_14380 [Akkermansiaceae bacterium]|nr:hypothetical protein [Akkermansiaceae bacterium]
MATPLAAGSWSAMINPENSREFKFLKDDAPVFQRALTRTVAGPDWFAFTPADKLGPSVIGMEDWLDKPAGKHDGTRLSNDRFQFTDGTPVKF